MSPHSPFPVFFCLLIATTPSLVFLDHDIYHPTGSAVVGVDVQTASQNKNADQFSKYFKKGHQQPFGESGQQFQIETKTEFPEPDDFFVNYVTRSKPLKLAGVARNSRAVRLWTDDYLMALDVPAGSVVQLETKKKENRQQETDEMHFHQFLKVYNQTEHYIVDVVPTYLRPDIMVPCSLQWKELLKRGFAFAVLWFSSGGTKSIIHTDSYDNINCLIRGEKTFIMVDPAKHRDKIFLRADGLYSDIDVDSVDLTQYPSLRDMEFYHVNITAGDCLYIPYKWIHQVRSYNSNVAVNFWWDHYASVDLHQSDSIPQAQCDPSLTLDQVNIDGKVKLSENYNSIRDQMLDLTISKPATVNNVTDSLSRDLQLQTEDSAADIAKEIFKKMDLNKDGQLTTEEHAEISVETWKEIREQVFVMVRELEAEGEKDEEVDKKRDEL